MMPEFAVISSDASGSPSGSVSSQRSASINSLFERFFAEKKHLDKPAIRQDLKSILDKESDCSLFDLKEKKIEFLNKHDSKFAFQFVEFLGKHKPRKVSIDEQRFNRILSDQGLRIVKEIGVGGQGTVYKCVYLDGQSGDLRTTPSPCAVKFVKFENTETTRQGFLAEVTSLKRLSKDHVIKLYEIFPICTNGVEHVGAFSMEYIPSGDLRQQLKKKSKNISPRAFMRIAEQLLKTLDEMHHLPVPLFHGDIKPANILLTGMRSDDVRLCVSNFFEETVSSPLYCTFDVSPHILFHKSINFSLKICSFS
jgi:hypothetical protein